MRNSATLQTGGVRNIAELQAIFRRVPRVIIGGLAGVVRAALAPYARSMRKNLEPRKRSGLLAKSIKPRVVQYGSGVVYGIVGPSRDVVGEYKGRRVVPGFYAHLVEYGTRAHAIGKGSYLKRAGRSRPQAQSGHMHPGAKAYPFRGPALQAAAAQSQKAADTKAEKLIVQSLEGLAA